MSTVSWKIIRWFLLTLEFSTIIIIIEYDLNSMKNWLRSTWFEWILANSWVCGRYIKYTEVVVWYQPRVIYEIDTIVFYWGSLNSLIYVNWFKVHPLVNVRFKVEEERSKLMFSCKMTIYLTLAMALAVRTLASVSITRSLLKMTGCYILFYA